MENMSHTGINYDMRDYADTQILNEEKLPRDDNDRKCQI